MSYLRSDIRTEVRDLFYETTADLVSDTQLNRLIKQEIRSLPRKGIYLEELWTTSTVVNQQDYSLPSGTYKVEMVERNWGTSDIPDWQEVKGHDFYAGALYLPELPGTVWTMRIHIRKAFSDLSDDVTNSDVPDEKMEVVLQGVLVRAYRLLIGYFKNAKNWDAIAKPDGVDMPRIMAWYQQAVKDYKEMLNSYRTYPLPREINLVS